MKVAFYGLAIIIFGIFGLILIGLFGDITVTNQQDYTLLKNSVEAAMYDSLDDVSYRKGFCVCTKINDDDGVYRFNTTNDYEIQNLYDDKTECVVPRGGHCEKMVGEIKIKEEVFVESFLRRFAENTKGSQSYKVVIKDIIEYPPKVSVEVRTYSKYNMFDSQEVTFDESDFEISNKIDSILEYR